MGNTMSPALALMFWYHLSLRNGFTGRDFAWLLIGALLAAVVIWALSRRKRRWI